MSSSGYRNKFVKLKTAKNRKTSSSKWLRRQLNDPYVSKAKIDGYRSRAAYKLIEMHEKFHLFKAGMKVVDLGAAPGGWSQIAVDLVGSMDEGGKTSAKGKVVAIDLLDIDPIPGVTFLKIDFLEEEAKNFLKTSLGGLADIVISDMAANTTGHAATDHLRIMELCSQAFHFAVNILRPGGHFVAKIFRGGTENELLSEIKRNFTIVKHFKPLSSRKESTEFYLVALNKK